MKTLVFAAVAFCLPLAALDNLPPLKEGLWTVTTQTISNPGGSKIEGSSSMCRSHATDEKARATAKSGMHGCTTTSDKFENGRYTRVSHCEIPGHVIDSTSVSTADGDSSTHSESHTTYKPALGGREETVVIMDQKYAGSCPAGMEPGDRMDKDGKVIHLTKPAN